MDGDKIGQSIETLKKWVPNLNSLKDEDYPSEAYRLLTALGYLRIPVNGISLDAEEESPQKDTLSCLLPPFTHPAFQKIADVALGHLLSGDFKQCFKPEPDAEKARCMLVLHCFKEQLHQPELAAFAYTALYELLYPGTRFEFQKREKFIDSTVLMSYSTLLELIENALDKCRQTEKHDDYEIQLLEALASQKDSPLLLLQLSKENFPTQLFYPP